MSPSLPSISVKSGDLIIDLPLIGNNCLEKAGISRAHRAENATFSNIMK
jgi:hypothetical protein